MCPLPESCTHLCLYVLLQGPQGPPGGVGPMGSVGEKVRVRTLHCGVSCLLSVMLSAGTEMLQAHPSQPSSAHPAAPIVTTCSLLILYAQAFCLS